MTGFRLLLLHLVYKLVFKDVDQTKGPPNPLPFLQPRPVVDIMGVAKKPSEVRSDPLLELCSENTAVFCAISHISLKDHGAQTLHSYASTIIHCSGENPRIASSREACKQDGNST